MTTTTTSNPPPLSTTTSTSYSPPPVTSTASPYPWIVQVNGASTFTSGIVVGDGSQVLTVLNFELTTPADMNLKVVAPGIGEYKATVQVIDSRTSAALLKLEGAHLPVAPTSNLGTFGQQTVVAKGWVTGNIYTEIQLGMSMAYSTGLTTGVYYLSFPSPIFWAQPRPGDIITDTSGRLIGLLGVDESYVFPHPTPPSFLPSVISISSALDLLASDSAIKPWANGPLEYQVSEAGSTWSQGLWPDYAARTIAIQELLAKMGARLALSDVPQANGRLLLRPVYPQEFLTLVYATPVPLTSQGVILAYAKWVCIEFASNGPPFYIYYGRGALMVDGGFVLNASSSEFGQVIPRPTTPLS
jgi:hypothetical protein